MLFSSRRAFTLVELLVVIAIIGILIALLLPAVQAAREAARRMQCSNNLKQLSLAQLNYEQTHKTLPPAGFVSNQVSWQVVILPYVEQGPLYEQFNLRAGWFANYGRGALALNRIQAFLCPSSDDELSSLHTVATPQGDVFPYTRHYYGVLGPQGQNSYENVKYKCTGVSGSYYGSVCQQGASGFPKGVRLAEITDGTSNTYLLGEISWRKMGRYRSWVQGWHSDNVENSGNALYGSRNVVYPINARLTSTQFNDVPFGSEHPGGCNLSRVDGSVQFVSGAIEQKIYLAIASRDGNEPIAAE